MSIKLDSDGLKREPINLTEDTWIYEEKIGISLYHRGERIGVIPLSTLRASMRRYNARKAGTAAIRARGEKGAK